MSDAKKKPISFYQKMRDVIETCSPQTQRFAILTLTVATSDNKPEDMDEFLSFVLALTPAQVEASKAEFSVKIAKWNTARGMEKEALGALPGLLGAPGKPGHR